jgi:hypothetical protein
MFSNRSWSKTIFPLVLSGVFAVLSACGSPTLPVADAASKAPADKSKTAKASDAKSTNKADSKGAETGKKTQQLVANFNFKDWDDKTPRRWTAEPADKAVKTAGAGPNSVHVELKPSGTDKFTTLRQRLSGNLSGKTLTITLRAKAFEAKMLSAKLTFETKSGPQTIVLDAAGRGGWESVIRTVSVPADAKADSGMLAVVLRPTAKKSALVDYVTIKAK